MHERKQEVLGAVLKGLVRGGAIRIGYNGIDSAGLNVNHDSSIIPYVDPIVRDLHRQIVELDLRYDAISSIPTGGDQWAEELTKVASSNEGRSVPLYAMSKGWGGDFSTIDGQGMRPGSRLIVVDDTIYLGGTSRSAVRVLKEAGYVIAAVAFPVAIGEYGRQYWREEEGIPTLTTHDDALVETLRHQLNLE